MNSGFKDGCPTEFGFSTIPIVSVVFWERNEEGTGKATRMTRQLRLRCLMDLQCRDALQLKKD